MIVTPIEVMTPDYLADVFAVWDGYGNEWVENGPVLLRFENGDIVLDRKTGKLFAYEQSDAEAQTSDEDILFFLVDFEEEEICPGWARSPLFSERVGTECEPGELLRSLS